MLSRIGFYTEIGYVYAPIVTNRLDDTHNSGGVTLIVGMRGVWGGNSPLP